MNIRQLLTPRLALSALLLGLLTLASACTAFSPTPAPEGAGVETRVTATTETVETPAATATTTPAPAATTTAATVAALANATYYSIYQEPVTLSDGTYQGEPFVEGGSERPTVTLVPIYAFGDLNGDGAEDAVALLAENSGGSGTFIYLAALVAEDGALNNVATAFIGDRTRVESLAIDGTQIVLEAITHRPEDPLCCPTQAVRVIYGLEDGQLVEKSSTGLEMESGSPQLAGPLWRWQQTLMNDGSAFVPDDPGDYTVQFTADGNVAIQADCNQVSGTYTVDNSSLTITLGPSTLVACPAGSLGDQFVANLAAAASYFIQDGVLFIDLMMDSGTMKFEAQSTELAGSAWIVTGYNNGRGAVVSPLLGTALTAAFDSAGQISGSAGCNQYSAPYEAEDGSITIGPPAATKMACSEPEGVMEQEAEFLAALPTAATYKFGGNTLELRTAEGALAVKLLGSAPRVSGAVP